MEKVKTHCKNFLQRVEKQFVYMLTIGAMFSIIGWAVPQVYFQYLDTTNYYSLSQPVAVDKTYYAPCEEVILSTKRVSLTDLVVDASNSLIKVNGEDPLSIVRVYEAPERPNLVVEQSTGKPVAFILTIPCDVSDGTYFWQGAVRYTVNDVDKTYIYTTDLFQVREET